jgi:hypothetical protein
MQRKKSDLKLQKHSLSLSERHGEWLLREEDRLQVSTSEIVRRALDREIERQELLIPRQRRKPLKTAEKRQMLLEKIAA